MGMGVLCCTALGGRQNAFKPGWFTAMSLLCIAPYHRSYFLVLTSHCTTTAEHNMQNYHGKYCRTRAFMHQTCLSLGRSIPLLSLVTGHVHFNLAIDPEKHVYLSKWCRCVSKFSLKSAKKYLFIVKINAMIVILMT